jgi:hypothetical protein
MHQLRAATGTPGFTSGGLGFVTVGEYENGVWRVVDDFTGVGGTNGMRFGRSIAMDPDTLIVGAPLDDVNGVTDAGSVFIFERDQQTGQWVQVQKLSAPTPHAGDEFGHAIAIDGDWMVIGAPRCDDAAHNAGATYFFVRQNATWVFGQQRLPPLPEASALFGWSIDIDGDWAIVGQPLQEFEIASGAAYIYENVAGSWTPKRFLPGLNGALRGRSVGIEGEWAFAGAPNKDVGGFEDSGAVEAFHLVDGVWQEVGSLPSEPSADYERAGWSLALDKGTLLVGVRESGSKGGTLLGSPGRGRAEWYSLNGEIWERQQPYRPIDQNGEFQEFGTAVAIDGTVALVGAPNDSASGAGYFFDLTGQTGTRCVLDDIAVQFGTPLDVKLERVRMSEDFRARIRSRFGFTASEANLAETRIGATNRVENPTALDLLIEARLNQSGGTMKVRVRNWNTNSFNQVRQYSIGSAETVEPVMDIPAANYIRLSDNRVELSLRASALATFSALGFEEQIDFVNILVHD